MSMPLSITIKLFGAFRNYFEGEEVVLSVEKGTSIQQLRTVLMEKISHCYPRISNLGLLQQSVFANQKSIMEEEEILTCDTALAILPPVCGG